MLRACAFLCLFVGSSLAFHIIVDDHELYYALRPEDRQIIYLGLCWDHKESRATLCQDLVNLPASVFSKELQKIVPGTEVAEGIKQEIIGGNTTFVEQHLSAYSYIHSQELQKIFTDLKLAYNPKYIDIGRLDSNHLSADALETVLELASRHPEKIVERRVADLIGSRSFSNSWKYRCDFKSPSEIHEMTIKYPPILIFTSLLSDIINFNDIKSTAGLKILTQYLKTYPDYLRSLLLKILTGLFDRDMLETYRVLLEMKTLHEEENMYVFWRSKWIISVLGLCHRDFTGQGYALPPWCEDAVVKWFNETNPEDVAPYLLAKIIQGLRAMEAKVPKTFKYNKIHAASRHLFASHFKDFSFPWFSVESQLQLWKLSLPTEGYFDSYIESWTEKRIETSALLKMLGVNESLNTFINFHPMLRDPVEVIYRDGASKYCEDLVCIIRAARESLLDEYSFLENFLWSDASFRRSSSLGRSFSRVLLMSILAHGNFGFTLQQRIIDCFTLNDCEGANHSIMDVRTSIAGSGIWNWLSPSLCKQIGYKHSTLLHPTTRAYLGTSLAFVFLVTLVSLIFLILQGN